MAETPREYRERGAFVRVNNPAQIAAGIAARPQAPAASPPPPPAWSRPSPDDGIAVSLGPAEDPAAPPNAIFTSWTTLPLTPSVLPVQIAGLWSDKQVVAGGQRSSFGGPENASIAFSGQLEEPAYYTSAANANSIAALSAGALNPAGVSGEGSIPGGAPFAGTTVPPEAAGAFGGVVVQWGGQGGFTKFVDAHTYKDMLEAACEAGEILRLVIGDEHGWNGLVSLRSFTWKYEDPDADVINYEFTAKRWVPPGSLVATAQGSSDQWYAVQAGDSLSKIASAKLHKHDQAAINTLIKLNLKQLGELWEYADSRYGAKGKQGHSAGPKETQPFLTQPGWQIGQNTAKHFDPNLALRHGWKLRLK